MVNRLIEVSLSEPFPGSRSVRFLELGLLGLLTTPIDAIPDLSDNRSLSSRNWRDARRRGGRPDHVSLTVSLQGLPACVCARRPLRVSMINVIFEDSVRLYFARSRVLERLNLLTKALPTGVVATSDRTRRASSRVLVHVEGKGYSLRDLRSLQDWFIRYQLNSVPASPKCQHRGTVRQYQSTSIPPACAPTRSRFRPSSTRSCAATGTSAATSVEAKRQLVGPSRPGLIESVRDVEDIVVGARPACRSHQAGGPGEDGDAFERRADQGNGRGGRRRGRGPLRVSTVDVINRVKQKIAALQAGLRRESGLCRSTTIALIERAVSDTQAGADRRDDRRQTSSTSSSSCISARC